MEDKRIEAVKQWPEPQLVRDIQVFLGFANFYRQFIQGFSWIAALLTSILKTAEPKKGGVGVGGDSRARRGGSKLDERRIDDDEVDGDEVDDEINDEGGTKVQKLSKSKSLSKSKKTVRSSEFLTPGAKQAFTELRQAFLKAPILHHFDPERHIQIETDASGYAIGGVLSQLILEDSGRWHLVAFFF